MNYKPIIIVSGEPNSIFFEIFFKTLKRSKFKKPDIKGERRSFSLNIVYQNKPQDKK